MKKNSRISLFLLNIGLFISAIFLFLIFTGCQSSKSVVVVPRWDKYECVLKSSIKYTNPVQQATLTATFVSPLGEKRTVYGFWDGGDVWKIRFMPDIAGKWTFTTDCSDKSNSGLDGKSGSFICTASKNNNRFTTHGAIRISRDRRYLEHQDLTPFFWLADTAWNGPLISTDEEWDFYLRTRASQKFTAVQWVATQWRAAPDGDIDGRLAYSGREKIEINPEFFQRLDKKVEQMNRYGLLSAPVLLWAFGGGSQPGVNPGISLPEDQAIILARYIVARWQGYHVVWILNGDGNYTGERSEKWRRIGRAVFENIYHAPVTQHPGGRMWILNEFIDEKWYDICGYQSAHNESDSNLKWIVFGPPSQDWKRQPYRPFISLEAPYENHQGDKGQMSADVVRRAHYWSLLNAPTAGITYGGHGVWGWDDGTRPPVDHPGSGKPLPWQKALFMPGAQQMRYLYEFFTSIDFYRLRPDPDIIVNQPADIRKHISAARSENKDLIVLYAPDNQTIELKLDALTQMQKSPNMTWHNPRTGKSMPAVAIITDKTCQIPVPEKGDWLLLIKAAE
ncbi:MAG: DUF4038 domain-containing protein [Verrucomicrobiia bacterium]